MFLFLSHHRGEEGVIVPSRFRWPCKGTFLDDILTSLESIFFFRKERWLDNKRYLCIQRPCKRFFFDVIVTSHSESLNLSVKKRWVDKRYSPHCRKCPLFCLLQKKWTLSTIWAVFMHTMLLYVCIWWIKVVLKDSIRYIYIYIVIDTIHYTYYILHKQMYR